jgi:hypothetical protein
MPTLPWVRLDAGFYAHDKILELVSRRHGMEAVAVYAFSLSWCGTSGTDGHVPKTALALLHAKGHHVELLVKARLWDPTPDGGWIVHNWDTRQATAQQTRDTFQLRRSISMKGNCVRWHGAECGCWRIRALASL